MTVERAAQRLLGHPQLAGRPVDADLVGQPQRLLGRGPVLQEPRPLGHRRASVQLHPLLGGRAGEDAVPVVVGLRAAQRGLQAGLADLTGGADLLGARDLVAVAAVFLGEEQLRVRLAAGRVLPPPPVPRIRRWGGGRFGELGLRGGGALVKGNDALLGAERAGHVPDVVGGHAQPVGQPAGARRRLVRVAELLGPQLRQPRASGRRPGPQAGKPLGNLPARHAELAGQASVVHRLVGANLPRPVAPLDLHRDPLGVERSAGDGSLLVAARGEVRLQPGHLLGGGLAVADGLGQQPGKAALAALLGAQRVQPLPGDLRGGPHLVGDLGRVQRHTAAQLAGKVGSGDPVADHPPAQLGKAGVALAMGAQHADQVAGQPRGDADLGRQRGGVDLVAAVDLARQPRVGDALPRRPRVRGGLGRAGKVLSGHCAPPSARPAADRRQAGG